MRGLAGKAAIVTGSSQGIGRGIAERLAAEGCRLVINGLDDGRPEAVAAALREFGGVDVLVNSAGWPEPISHILEMTEDHWDRVLRTNLKSVYLFTRRAGGLMVQDGRRG